MDEAFLHFVGFFGEFCGAFAGVLNREAGGNHQHVFDRIFALRLQQHARDGGVDW